MLQVVNCNYEIMLKMQWNPGKQKLTDRLFRGFWIRERAHFHPVGQSPGGMCRGTKEPKRMEAGRESSGQKYTSERKVRRGCQRGGTKDSDMKDRGTYNTYEQIMRTPKTPKLKETQNDNKQCVPLWSFCSLFFFCVSSRLFCVSLW